MSVAELYQTPPARGSWNMAIDQALLEHCEATGHPIVRLYRWTPATLSLGYFQKFNERLLHAPSSGLSLVRRATGGGAIVHDRELTYSLCMPSEERWSRENRALYDSVHEAILAAFRRFGVSPQLYTTPPSGVTEELSGCGAQRAATAAPFLCFQRRANGDIVLEGHKIGGSAQRRGKLALLQHGSILLQKSDFAPELPGVEEITGIPVDLEAFSKTFLDHLARELNLQFEVGNLSEPLKKRAQEIEQQTFAASDWNENR